MLLCSRRNKIQGFSFQTVRFLHADFVPDSAGSEGTKSEGTVRQRERQSVLRRIRRGGYIRCLCGLIDETIIRAAKKYHIKMNESTIKTAALRGELLAF